MLLTQSVMNWQGDGEEEEDSGNEYRHTRVSRAWGMKYPHDDGG